MIGRLCQMLAPMLAFTADEAWEFIPSDKVESVHLSEWKPKVLTGLSTETDSWAQLFRIREQALPDLEKARQAKVIGKALDAKISLAGESVQSLNGHEESLRELLNVSQLQVVPGTPGEVTVNVLKADGEKCERCWHWETTVGAHPEHKTLCHRCIEAIQFKA